MRDVKDNRSLLSYILLTIITLGIYQIWFLHHLAKDVNLLCEPDGKRTSGVLALFLLSLVTCGLYGFFWYYRIGDMLGTAVRRRGLTSTISGSTVLLCHVLSIFVCSITFFVALHKIFEATNELALDYNLARRTRAAESADTADAED